MPAETAETPKLWRRPLGEAWGPESPAACMRAWMARQPVMRDQGQRRMPRLLPRRAWCSRMPWTRSRALSRAGGTGTARSAPALSGGYGGAERVKSAARAHSTPGIHFLCSRTPRHLNCPAKTRTNRTEVRQDDAI